VKASKPDEISILCIKDGFGRGRGYQISAYLDVLTLIIFGLPSRSIYHREPSTFLIPVLDISLNISSTTTMTDPIPTSRGSSLAYPEMVRFSSILA